MKTGKTIFGALAPIVILSGCYTKRERVETHVRDRETPVVEERVIERAPSSSTTIVK